VVLRKLRQFQDLGHQAVLIIGDYTALIGDPSGQDKTRPALDATAVERNARTYLEQVGKILDEGRLEVVRNSSWFSKLSFRELVELASKMTVARLLERNDFGERFKAQRPIGLHELLYPLMQGYDSVMVNADVELGGTDQTFNLMVGRDLLREAGKEPQVTITMPLLVGLDGTKKMSKSLGNYVGVAEPAEEMFGKLMSIPDELMADYFELLTTVPLAEYRSALAEGHPMEVKKQLATDITSTFHDAEAARAARANFEQVFSKREVPDEMPELIIDPATLDGGTAEATWLVSQALGAGHSASECRRLITQGAVTLDNGKISDVKARVTLADGQVLKVGKRRFFRIRFKS